MDLGDEARAETRATASSDIAVPEGASTPAPEGAGRPAPAAMRRALAAGICLFTLAGAASFYDLNDRDRLFEASLGGIADGLASAVPAAADIAASRQAIRERADAAAAEEREPLVVRSVEVGRGDTLMGLLVSAGAAPTEAHEAVQALRSVYDPRDLQVGQEVTITFAPPEGGEAGGTGVGADDMRLLDVALKADVDRKVLASRMLSPDSSFSGQEQRQELHQGFGRFAGTIDDSLFFAASRAGLPVTVTAELIRMFSYDIDFQRDIQPGDGFEVYVERWFDGDGRAVKEGAIAYAALTLSGQKHQLWRFAGKDGQTDYFNEKGDSVRKALLKTPIDGARITSGFGMRRHPILGYSKKHLGLDFGAGIGTPIMAAGDGSVAFAGAKGAYGNYVQLRHAGGYGTAYAHMSRIAVKKGQTVRQGQIIGYVGSTGRSTGPHLHYEVLVKDRQVNPAGLKLPTGRKLEGAELAAFHKARAAIDEARADQPLLTASNATAGPR